MRFYPRYSLLSLFLLTAAIAGGVKLWYGPHHVVDGPSKNWEIEFTYTRDWNGNKIVHGPVVQRQFEDEQLVFFVVSYCRQGTDSNWVYGCCVQKDGCAYRQRLHHRMPCPLKQYELLAVEQTREAELQRIAAAGIRIQEQYQGVVDQSQSSGGIGLGR